MSKGYICDICNKTKTVTKEERNFIPDDIKGWLHIETWKRIDLDEMHAKGMPNDPIQYNEIDICPECMNKIADSKRFADYETGNAIVLDFVSRILE